MSSGTHVSASEVAHQSLQFAWEPASLATGLNLDAGTPPGYQHRRLECGRLPQIRDGLQQREVGVAIRSDGHHAQRIAMAQIGPGAVAHDEESPAYALRRVDPRARAPHFIQLGRVHASS